jgi:hypothetical protein
LPFNDLSGECATSAQMYRWFVLRALCHTEASTVSSDCQPDSYQLVRMAARAAERLEGLGEVVR